MRPAPLLLAITLPACATSVPSKGPLPQPALLSAFFGLDDALPAQAFLLCTSAPGADGMPVVFSRRLLADPDPEAFEVTRRSGTTTRAACATRAPARGADEGHTILLAGDFGDPTDPPVRVTIVDEVTLDGDAPAKGLFVDVTALEEGPSLVLASAHAPGSIDSNCPEDTRQIVQVAWAGGVTATSDESHRRAYLVKVGGAALAPFALGDLGDNDNYVHLCLDRDGPITEVFAEAARVLDPRGDPNPQTRLLVSTPAR